MTNERELILTYLRRGAATLLTSDMDQMNDAEDRRELETAARALECAADEIEKGKHLV